MPYNWTDRRIYGNHGLEEAFDYKEIKNVLDFFIKSGMFFHVGKIFSAALFLNFLFGYGKKSESMIN